MAKHSVTRKKQNKTLARAEVHTFRAPAQKQYEPDIGPKENADFYNAHTIPQMMKVLAENKKIQVEATVLGVNKKGELRRASLGRKSFMEAMRRPEISPRAMRRLREGFSDDVYGGGGGWGWADSGDFAPLLGGPFNKQQYIKDYLQAHMESFYAYHHDPLGRRLPSIMRDYTLGRDWTIKVKANTDVEEKYAQAVWNATEKVNDIRAMMETAAVELSVYGEEMVWELPSNQVNVIQNRDVDELVRRGLLPRFRLTDPSCIWDIITWPEDITNVLAYQWVAPTQYQIYTKDNATDTQVPTLKYIYQQIPASQLDHFKINCVSNEKRGRSDFYPILGYLKRLRELVNYDLIARQKAAAYFMDTTVQGSQADIQAYVTAQENLGPIAPAGSEFVHTAKIERKYLGTDTQGTKDTSTFEECVSMICAGYGISVHMLGMFMGSNASRASAMVQTEPAVKVFEGRRSVYTRMLTAMFNRTMKKFNIQAECEVIFPEIVSQDRSTKMADIGYAETQQWISPERAASMGAKELGVEDYNYAKEQQDIKSQAPDPMLNPLTTPGAITPNDPMPVQKAPTIQPPVAPHGVPSQKPGGLAQTGSVSQNDRKNLAQNRG